MASASLFFDIFGRDKGVGKTFDEIGSKGKTLGGALKGVGMAMGAGLLAITAAVAHSGIEKLKDQSASIAQLEAGIKSTGNAAHVSVGGMSELADSVQNYSGQTSDSIMSAESLLLTFTNIKNVGANKIFDETTKAAADMAAKLGTDAAPQAMLLGKALQDPATGMTRLMRAGVSFTAAQRDQIKAMQASGNILGAQKLILGEVSKEFGGAAKAAGNSLPGELKKADNAFKDMSANLLSALMPVLLNVAKAMTGVATWASQNKGFVMALAIAVGILAVAFIVLSAAAAIVASPFIWIGLVIAALVAGVIIAYNRLGWFKDGVNAIMAFLVAVFQNVISFISTVMVPIWVYMFTNIVSRAVMFGAAVAAVWNAVVGAIGAAVGWIGVAINNAIGFFNSMASGVGSAISAAINWVNQFGAGVGNAVNVAIAFVASIPGAFLGALGALGGMLFGIGASIIQGFLDGLLSVWNAVTSFVGGIASWIKDHKGPLSYDEVLLQPAGAAIMGGLHKALKAGIPDITATLGGLTADIGGTRINTTYMNRQMSGVGAAAAAAQHGTQHIYVQNPWGSDFMEAKTDARVGAGFNQANQDLGRRPSR